MSRTRPATNAAAIGVALLVALVACDPAPDVEPQVCRKPEAAVPELGVGNLATGFQSIEDGAGVTVALGPQGLHMVVLSMRLTGFELPTAGAKRTRVRASVRDQGKVIAGADDPSVQPSKIDGDQVEFVGIRAIFQADEVDPLDGVLADFHISVRDGCGREIEATRQLVLEVPSADK